MEDKHYWVLNAILFGIFIGIFFGIAIMASQPHYMSLQYRQGQIDAQNNKIEWILKKNEDGSTSWVYRYP